MHNPKLKGRLHRIRIPTLFLWGASDRILIAKPTGAPIAPPIPGARFEPIERAGHFPHLEQPEEFARRVLAFVGRQVEAPLRRSPSMRVYQFTEQPYFPVWNDHDGSLRVNLPNRKIDPKVAADLLSPLLRRVADLPTSSASTS